MKERVLVLLAATALLLLLSVEKSSGNFFSSLQFTRESLMDFSRGSERTVEILTPKKTTKTVMKHKPVVFSKKKKVAVRPHSVHKGMSVWGLSARPRPAPKATQLPVTETVVTYQRKRKVYRRRTSPSNKFLEVINDIERAVANAKASGVRYSDRTLAKLKAVVERAIQSKSYKYARQVSRKALHYMIIISSILGCQN